MKEREIARRWRNVAVVLLLDTTGSAVVQLHRTGVVSVGSVVE